MMIRQRIESKGRHDEWCHRGSKETRSALAPTDDTTKHTLGLFLAPLIPCHIPPPIVPMANAPPKSFKITYGLSNQLDSMMNARQLTRDLSSDHRETWLSAMWLSSEVINKVSMLSPIDPLLSCVEIVRFPLYRLWLMMRCMRLKTF